MKAAPQLSGVQVYDHSAMPVLKDSFDEKLEIVVLLTVASRKSSPKVKRMAEA